ncbi:hypothetical protein [Pectobacterium brasiliense]|uniref:hypothetical protein n=1 Tax=Pectobacterium brasiliense TaxID=180957 RepID=UPI0025A20260|nr:hypothetical protein [Pectobacterium brasiliense]WJM81184.1 hypothetical protein QTI90_23975 [Pectobacterium brasiliense]
MSLRILVTGASGFVGGSFLRRFQGPQAVTEVNFWYSGGTKPQKMMLTLIDEFNRSQDQYVVKSALQGNYDETWKKLQAGMAAKNAPAFALLTALQGTALAERNPFKTRSDYLHGY